MVPTIRPMGIADSRRMVGIGGGGPSVVLEGMGGTTGEEDSTGLLVDFHQGRRPRLHRQVRFIHD